MKGVILLGLCALIVFVEAVNYQGFLVNEPFAPYPVLYSEPLQVFRIRRSPGVGYRRPGGSSVSSSQSSSSSTSVSQGGGFGGGSISQSGASSSSVSSSGGGGYGGRRHH